MTEEFAYSVWGHNWNIPSKAFQCYSRSQPSRQQINYYSQIDLTVWMQINLNIILEWISPPPVLCNFPKKYSLCNITHHPVLSTPLTVTTLLLSAELTPFYLFSLRRNEPTVLRVLCYPKWQRIISMYHLKQYEC